MIRLVHPVPLMNTAFSLSSSPPADLRVDLLAIACDDDAVTESAPVAALDQALGGTLRRAIHDERFRGKPGQTLVLHTQERLPATRIVLIGVGGRASLRLAAMLPFAGRAARLAAATGASSLALLPPASVTADLGDLAATLTQGTLLGCYRFDRYLSDETRAARVPATVQLLLGPGDGAAGISRGQTLAAAVTRARDMVNEPAAAMTPTRLADVAREIASGSGELDLVVLGPQECRDRGMGLFLAVAQGSTEEPRFIHLAWKPTGLPRPGKRVVLVGKGVTFDSGGLSLKPNDAMLDMKTDMAGAAAVLAAMEAVARLRLPLEVHALAACTENMPSGRAYKLGDVLRSKAGKTVEINNTDAEGRLTLADAITYGLELRPDVVLDFATLTGACVVALGPHIAGVMGNDDALIGQWLAAAKAAGEEMWHLPLPDRLADQLKSEIADMKNTGERWGGALTAGLFLKEFVGQVPWIHVDLAGPSSTDKENGHIGKGGTGFAVSTIVEYLRRLS
jgi:leucyl aminopeptidase